MKDSALKNRTAVRIKTCLDRLYAIRSKDFEGGPPSTYDRIAIDVLEELVEAHNDRVDQMDATKQCMDGIIGDVIKAGYESCGVTLNNTDADLGLKSRPAKEPGIRSEFALRMELEERQFAADLDAIEMFITKVLTPQKFHGNDPMYFADMALKALARIRKAVGK
jgi:hypothetical protein